MNRTKLHNSSQMKWFNSRCQKSTSDKYKNLPEQIVYDQIQGNLQNYIKTLEQLFKEFDEDGSGSLDKYELLDMFNKYGINLTREEMDNFFSQIDSNGDQSLNLQEFKKCVQNEDANKLFTSMMLKLRKRMESSQDSARRRVSTVSSQRQRRRSTIFQQSPRKVSKLENIEFLDVPPPLTFKKVLKQISYMEKKSKLVKDINNNSNSMDNRLKNLKNLVNLSNQIDVQTQYYQHQNLKTDYRQVDYTQQSTISISSQSNSRLRKQLSKITENAKLNGLQLEAQQKILSQNSYLQIPNNKSSNIQNKHHLFKYIKKDQSPVIIKEKANYFLKCESKLGEINKQLNDYLKQKPYNVTKEIKISKSLEKLDQRIYLNLKNKKIFTTNPEQLLAFPQKQLKLDQLRQNLSDKIQNFTKVLDAQKFIKLDQLEKQENSNSKNEDQLTINDMEGSIGSGIKIKSQRQKTK